MNHDVFISHATEDQSVALAACAALEQNHFRCWIAPRDILAGDRWAKSIMTAIESTRIVVVVLSQNSIASSHVQSEVERAVEYHLPVIPFRIDLAPLDGALEFLLKPHQFLNAIGSGSKVHLDALVRAVAARTDNTLPRFPALKPGPVDDHAKDVHTPGDDHKGFERSAREMLFGVLAVQLDLITPERFTDACAGWFTQRHSTLAEILTSRGWIDDEDRADVERFLERRLKRFDGSIAASLHASLQGPIRQQLNSVEARVVVDTAARMSTDPYRAIESQADTTVPELAHYERVQRWRQGGLGQVWLARDTSIGREVALKTVNDQSLDACAATGRLLEEARITGQLEHPGVVPVYAVGRDAAGGPFYAMRLVRGKTLTESISDFHELTDDTSRRNERRALLRSLISVANVVAYAHSRGVVHLDLKPDNVVVGMFGEVTLLDWGLAIQFSGGRVFGSHEGLADPNQLDARNPVGTPGYMAPEQARADYNSIGIQTDVYGLGAILFEMLCGQAPHLDKPPDCMVDLVGRECTPDVRSRADVPASLAEICSKAMAFYPTDRFEGALAFVEHLQNWLDEEPLLNYRSAVRKFEERITRDPRDLPSREGQARYRVYLALVLSGMDRNPEAAESLAIAISTYRILVANRPTQARYRAELASALLHQRGVLRRAGKLNESEAATRDALREYQHLIERGEESAQEQSIVAMSLLSIDDEATIGGDSRTTATIQEIMEQFRETRLGSEPASPEDTILELTDIPFYRYAADTAEHGASAIREESDHLMFDDESTRFQLLTIFQVGGLSQLFIAKDKQLQREVLVKTLKVEHRYSRELAQRLYQEAEIMARLEHPGIVPVYSVGDFPDGQPYFAMKKVSGQNLADAITSFHSVAGEVKRVDDWHRHVRSMLLHFVAVCDTAAYAHGRGVVHGDIKPGNVILGQFGETILMDWGLATVLERDKLLPLSFGPAWAVPAKGRYGTPRYMSPEQAFGDGVDYRTDVFGLGATLYFILTGRPPYGVSLSIADTLQEAMAVRIARPRDVNRFLSTSLEQVCLKALAREKDKRYQSAVQLSTDINSCLADDTLVQ